MTELTDAVPTPQPPKTKPRLDQFRVWLAGTSKVYHLTLSCGVVDRWLAEPGNHPSQLSCVERAGLVERRLTVCTSCAEQAEVVDTVRSVA
jgi:hypothetical protein